MCLLYIILYWIFPLLTFLRAMASSSITQASCPGPSGHLKDLVQVTRTLCFKLFWSEGKEKVKPTHKQTDKADVQLD